ncbi:hypothetical protein CYY_003172 [Polysphondylium violaceum]|uniref:PiggyBac transposable element-derived protein domain-containing protein n=1 Tax=Polysphondylium violaceum TaxID=133409 RepID=A0A8J4PXG1_9MYCE|nr:hypothetical protein CYY_003172 [Polysphondylium violaceum]
MATNSTSFLNYYYYNINNNINNNLTINYFNTYNYNNENQVLYCLIFVLLVTLLFFKKTLASLINSFNNNNGSNNKDSSNNSNSNNSNTSNNNSSINNNDNDKSGLDTSIESTSIKKKKGSCPAIVIRIDHKIEQDIKDYFAIFIYSGLIRTPSVEEFWRKRVNVEHFSFYDPSVSKIMSFVKRFKAIHRCIHFEGYGNAQRGTDLGQIYKFTNDFIKKEYKPGRVFSFDDESVATLLENVRTIEIRTNQISGNVYLKDTAIQNLDIYSVNRFSLYPRFLPSAVKKIIMNGFDINKDNVDEIIPNSCISYHVQPALLINKK